MVDGSAHISLDEPLVSGASDAPDDTALLTTRLAPRIFQMATRVLKDKAEAEDITQEAMLRLWRIAPTWRTGEAHVGTWLYRVALNLCRDRLRRRKGRDVALDEVAEPEDDRASAAERMQETSRTKALEQALSELPERQRQAVILRHLQELSNPEIAEIMEISVEAVESLTARGKRSLAAKLAGRRDELGYENDR